MKTTKEQIDAVQKLQTEKEDLQEDIATLKRDCDDRYYFGSNESYVWVLSQELIEIFKTLLIDNFQKRLVEINEKLAEHGFADSEETQ